MLDPEIVRGAGAAGAPTTASSPTQDEQLLHEVAEGRPVKAIAARAAHHARGRQRRHRVAVPASWPRARAPAREGALRRLRLLQTAIVDREEQGETLSRLLPGGLAEKLRDDRGAAERTERLVVTVLMSDVRGYSAHRRDAPTPRVLAGAAQHAPAPR